MKIFLIVLAGLIATPLYSKSSSRHKHDIPSFVILIASYNNEKYVVENLKSACFQKSTRPYHIIYINDASSDNTGQLVEDFRREHNLESLMTVIHNKKNVGPLTNYFYAIQALIPDDKVVVNLDGDDFLAHNDVLLRLESIYSDSDVWMTSGSCLEYPSMKPCNWLTEFTPEEIINNQLRKRHYGMHHLRTFKAALFKKIRPESLMFEGLFLRYAGDVAYMLPMVEMCRPYTKKSKFHYRFINEVLYYWRTNTLLNDFHGNKDTQLMLGRYIRSQKPYEPLKSLK